MNVEWFRTILMWIPCVSTIGLAFLFLIAVIPWFWRIVRNRYQLEAQRAAPRLEEAAVEIVLAKDGDGDGDEPSDDDEEPEEETLQVRVPVVVQSDPGFAPFWNSVRTLTNLSRTQCIGLMAALVLLIGAAGIIISQIQWEIFPQQAVAYGDVVWGFLGVNIPKELPTPAPPGTPHVITLGPSPTPTSSVTSAPVATPTERVIVKVVTATPGPSYQPVQPAAPVSGAGSGAGGGRREIATQFGHGSSSPPDWWLEEYGCRKVATDDFLMNVIGAIKWDCCAGCYQAANRAWDDQRLGRQPAAVPPQPTPQRQSVRQVPTPAPAPQPAPVVTTWEVPPKPSRPLLLCHEWQLEYTQSGQPVWVQRFVGCW